MVNILIAPNSFKGSFTAIEVSEFMKRGFVESHLDCTCDCFPIADGGDGTDELLGKFTSAQRQNVSVTNALGKPIIASYWLKGKEAFINVSSASGFRSLKRSELNPMLATSIGTGQLIKNAFERGAKRIVLGLGGSVTVDAGSGILSALGVTFKDYTGNLLDPVPENLHRLFGVDFSNVDNRMFDVEFVVLADVQNRLLGENGAARIFGSQKGASPEQVQQLEKALENVNSVIANSRGVSLHDIPSGGAAGGIGAMMAGVLNAKLISGADFILSRFAFDKHLSRADILVTGEGTIDEQTLEGKGPFAVARRAFEAGKPCIGIAGNVPLIKSEKLAQYFPILQSICNKPLSLSKAIRLTPSNISRTTYELGNAISLGSLFKN